MVNMPKIIETDYTEDDFFKPIYQYLNYDKQTKNKETDRKNSIVILLYKLSLPRTRKEQRVRSENYQLCISQKHKDNLLLDWHNLCGHFKSNKLLSTIVSRFY